MKNTIRNPKTEIVVLGVGTAKDRALRVSVWAVARKMGIITEVVLVSDINRIVASGIGAIPALVIDDQVVMEGRLPSITEIMELLQPFA